MELALLAQEVAVCRLEAEDDVPAWAWRGEFVSITRVRGELSVMCAVGAVPADDGLRAEGGWRVLAVTTSLDFDVVGVAAALTRLLAVAGISVLPVATHDTDYFLVKQERLADAIEALVTAGHSVTA